jgi:hypothetical protein
MVSAANVDLHCRLIRWECQSRRLTLSRLTVSTKENHVSHLGFEFFCNRPAAVDEDNDLGGREVNGPEGQGLIL